MKIEIKDLTPSKHVKIKGNEVWLAELYKDFHVAEGPSPQLTGDLSLTLEEGGSVRVTGKVTYAPFVPCSRCAKHLCWSLVLDVEARFLPEDQTPAPREKNLSKAELDAYYLEDHAVDLEQLVNDTVHTGLPSRLLRVTDDGKACQVCLEDLTGDLVYGKRNAPAAEASPFALLKGLKLPN